MVIMINIYLFNGKNKMDIYSEEQLLDALRDESVKRIHILYETETLPKLEKVKKELPEHISSSQTKFTTK